MLFKLFSLSTKLVSTLQTKFVAGVVDAVLAMWPSPPPLAPSPLRTSSKTHLAIVAVWEPVDFYPRPHPSSIKRVCAVISGLVFGGLRILAWGAARSISSPSFATIAFCSGICAFGGRCRVRGRGRGLGLVDAVRGVVYGYTV